MRPADAPPRGLGWTIAPFGRLLSFALAVAALSLSVYVGYRYVGLVDCLRHQNEADQRRTAAIAAATDDERYADLQLLSAVEPGQRAEWRALAIKARQHTDRVRAANPAPALAPCK